MAFPERAGGSIVPIKSGTDGRRSMLAQSDLVAFVATADAAKARAFYQDTLRLKLIEDSPFAVVFDANGTMLRVTKVQNVVAVPYTILGWQVTDIAAEVRELAARGIRFEKFPGMDQDEDGIWVSPGGARVAWFKDPDGNTLSLTQAPG